MPRHKINPELLIGMMRHDNDVSIQPNRTDGRIFDLQEVSQSAAIESNQIRNGRIRIEQNRL
jgi:hypothetical protein